MPSHTPNLPAPPAALSAGELSAAALSTPALSAGAHSSTRANELPASSSLVASPTALPASPSTDQPTGNGQSVNTAQSPSTDQSPKDVESATTDQSANDTSHSRTALVDVLNQVCGVRTDVETLLARLSTTELQQHHAQLDELRELLETCASALPSPSEATQSDASIAAKKPPTDYFDLLPPGPLDNIMRYLSARPNSEEWAMNIEPADAEALYLGEGVLCDSFRKRFTKVELQTNTTAPRTAEMYLRTRTWNVGALDVMRRAGEYITEVTYTGDRENNSPPHMVNWIERFRDHCTNVTHLYLNKVHINYFGMILEARDGKLRSLTLDSLCSSRNHLFIAARHCGGLKKISIQPGVSVPESLWETIGPSLEDLELSPKGPVPKDVLKSVQTHCRALRRINVSKDCPYMQLSDLLVSYGVQLEFAKGGFGVMPFPQCRRIAESCPNAIFELSNVAKLDVISGLQYRMYTLKLGKSVHEPVPPDFFESFSMLRCLSLTYGDGDAGWFLSSLLRSEKTELVEVGIHALQDNPLEIMSILASRTTSLQTLRLWSKELPVQGLAAVLQANKKMRTIHFKVRVAEVVPVQDMLRICSSCEELRELRVFKLAHHAPAPMSRTGEAVTANASDIARTADLCIPLRRTGNCFVQIFNVDYLT